MDWFRWFAGTASDPGLLVVARRSGQPTANVLALWAMLLERANASVPRGEIKRFDFETADLFLEMPEGSAEAIVQALRDKGYLEGDRISRQAACRAFCEEEKAMARTREIRSPRQEKAETPFPLGDINVTRCHVRSRTVTLEEKRREKKRKEGKIYSCAEQGSSAQEKAAADPLDSLLKACPEGESRTFPAWLKKMLAPERETFRKWRNEHRDTRVETASEYSGAEQRRPGGPCHFREALSRHADPDEQSAYEDSDQFVQNLFRQVTASEARETEVEPCSAGNRERKGPDRETCSKSHLGQGRRNVGRIAKVIDSDQVVAISQRKHAPVGHFVNSNAVVAFAEKDGSILEQRRQDEAVLPVPQTQRGIAFHEDDVGDVIAISGLQSGSTPDLTRGERIVPLAKRQADIPQKVKRESVVAVSSANVASSERIGPNSIIPIPKRQGCIKNGVASNGIVPVIAPDLVTSDAVGKDNKVIARAAKNQCAVREIEDKIVPVAGFNTLPSGVDDNLVDIPVQFVPHGFRHGAVRFIDAGCPVEAQVKRHTAAVSFMNPHVVSEIKIEPSTVRTGKLHRVQGSAVRRERKTADADQRSLRTGCFQGTGGP